MKLQAILKTMTDIKEAQKQVTFTGLDQVAMNLGLSVSRQALSQPEDISLTPYSKNALEKLDGKEYLYVSDPTSNMEKYYEKETLKLLKKYCPNQSTDYDMKANPWDKSNYDVDCWRNFKRGSDVRHVEKGMNKQREVNFSKFYKPMKFIPMTNFNSKLLEEAFDLLNKSVPNVKSSSS